MDINDVYNVIFIDKMKTALKVFSADSVEIHTFDINNEFIKQILLKFDIETIEKNTYEFEEKEVEMKLAFQEFLTGDKQEYIKEKEIDIFDTPTAEILFKTKLKVFEQQEVKESKDRDIKSKIRKSKDLIEIIGLYYNLREGNVQPDNE